MRSSSTSLFAIFISLVISAQNGEFETHDNGLIYDSNTIGKLQQIVDSLNLQFKACDLFETYYSMLQTKVHYIKLPKRGFKKALEDLKNEIHFEDFIKKYPKVEFHKNLLLVKDEYKNYKKEDITTFRTVTANDKNEFEISKDSKKAKKESYKKNTWIVSNAKGTNSIIAFFLLDDLKSEKIQDKYAEMIQYADCMIDTTSTKVHKNAERGYIEFPKNYSSFSLEEKEDLLKQLRSTKVVGMCSMDSSPRTHAINIAQVSAETVNWEVFLKAHLDIMNDRFDRMSDGSYAWAARKTYIKELEVLNINVIDLLLGTTIRFQNHNPNHYFGNIGRLGRALAESKDRLFLENKLVSMIEDPQLDDYNRIMLYYLLSNYRFSIGDETERELLNSKINNLNKKLPEHLFGKS